MVESTKLGPAVGWEPPCPPHIHTPNLPMFLNLIGGEVLPSAGSSEIQRRRSVHVPTPPQPSAGRVNRSLQLQGRTAPYAAGCFSPLSPSVWNPHSSRVGALSTGFQERWFFSGAPDREAKLGPTICEAELWSPGCPCADGLLVLGIVTGEEFLGALSKTSQRAQGPGDPLHLPCGFFALPGGWGTLTLPSGCGSCSALVKGEARDSDRCGVSQARL